MFVMTRDEYDLIEDWVLYHGALFGYHNLVIIDNNSVDPRVLDVYKRYVPKGVTVVEEKNYVDGGQGQAFTKHMQRYKDTCQFLIGLDTDEFMVIKGHARAGALPSARETAARIKYYLTRIDERVGTIIIDTYFASVVDPTSPMYRDNKMHDPARNIVSFAEMNCTKMIYRAQGFLKTINGNHDGQAHGERMGTNELMYVHFHSTGKRRIMERARNVMSGYMYCDTSAPLLDQLSALQPLVNIRCNGCHRIDQYFDFLHASYIYDLFIRHIKRPPTHDELARNVNDRRKIPPLATQRDFENCAEALHARDIDVPCLDEEHKNSVIYYEPSIVTGRDGVVEWRGLANILHVLRGATNTYLHSTAGAVMGSHV